MQPESTFKIYNASAGSGKTFTLVKEYLKIVLISDDIFIFQKILAITFTNKAASEMKQRILNSLKDFSEAKQPPLFILIQKETGLEPHTIKKKSTVVLQLILENYGAFHITTIDSFTFKIIKSFSFDLGLSQNFEVEMNAQELLDKAVEVLISKVGVTNELTKLLVEYSIDKSDDDKSWDISLDLLEFSKILLKEEDVFHFRKLSDKTLHDFKSLQIKLAKHRKDLLARMKSIGEQALQIISNEHLEFTVFNRSMLPNHFLSLVNKTDRTKFFDQSVLKKRIDENELLSKTKPKNTLLTAEKILPALLKLYSDSELLYQKLIQTKLILQSIIPLAVLNHINKELNTIKEDNNIRLNAEFNQLISDNIQDQPAPFIYERIGQSFMHYFIDEMQDTSVLQWKNLIPLIDNSLSQEKTSLLLVGDAKQAIYRWRGGKASQFLKLGSQGAISQNPFTIEKKVQELSTNYRSFSELIKFNNSFFKHSSQFLQNSSYADLFLNKSHQEENESKGGYVSISFLEKMDNKEEDQLKYAKKVHQIITNLDSKCNLGSVCVLVRKRSEGVTVANYLSENNIDIVSSETLLLSNSKKVKFIVNFLRYSVQSNDKECLLELLYFLHKHLMITLDKHSFFRKFIDLEQTEVLDLLKEYNCSLNLILFHESPFYEKVEQIIRAFHLQDSTDAYVQFFLDEILIQQQKESNIQDFLNFWDLKKESLSIVSSENPDAVKIMTIHKAKGLEFPVVIFPCELYIYQDIKPKVWLENTIDDFSNIMVPLNKEIRYTGVKGEEIYNIRKSELELDSFNLLYVALTRAVEQLYIITEKKLNKKEEEDPKYFSGIFISYLKKHHLWHQEKNEYSFGDHDNLKTKLEIELASKTQQKFISTPWKDHKITMLANSSTFWGTKRGEAKNYGNLIHKILSEVITKDDVHKVTERYFQQGEIGLEEKEQLQERILKIVSHTKLKGYYSKDVVIYNEREILFKANTVIPDRLVFDNNNWVTIIDYKTGISKKEHHYQLENYASVLASLNYLVAKKVLVYINKTISVEEF